MQNLTPVGTIHCYHSDHIGSDADTIKITCGGVESTLWQDPACATTEGTHQVPKVYYPDRCNS